MNAMRTLWNTVNWGAGSVWEGVIAPWGAARRRNKIALHVSAQDLLDELHSVFDRETQGTLIRALMETFAGRLDALLQLAYLRGDDQLFVDFSEGDFLDRHAAMYLLRRWPGESDESLRIRIYQAIKANKVTRPRIIEHVEALTGHRPTIYEYLDSRDSWYLGVSALGVDTRLWDTDTPEDHIFAFWIVVPCPSLPTWFLGLSGIGVDTVLYDLTLGSWMQIDSRLRDLLDDIKAAGVTAYIILQTE